MGRSVYQYSVSDMLKAQDIAEKVLQESGFVQKTLRTGELVWRRGSGWVTSQQFVSVYYIEAEHLVQVYAWIQGGFGVPGMGEKELEGLGAVIPRKQLTKVILRLQDEFEKIRL